MKFVYQKNHKKCLLMVLIFVTANLKSEFEAIGLGSICSTAAALSTFELRNAAYPFDWTISNFPCLYSTIQENFQDFLNPSYFRLRGDNHGVINKNGIIFVHDFPTIHYQGNDIGGEDNISEALLSGRWLEALPAIQEKYTRRIQRFIATCNSQKRYIFLDTLASVNKKHLT